MHRQRKSERKKCRGLGGWLYSWWNTSAGFGQCRALRHPLGQTTPGQKTGPGQAGPGRGLGERLATLIALSDRPASATEGQAPLAGGGSAPGAISGVLGFPRRSSGQQRLGERHALARVGGPLLERGEHDLGVDAGGVRDGDLLPVKVGLHVGHPVDLVEDARAGVAAAAARHLHVEHGLRHGAGRQARSDAALVCGGRVLVSAGRKCKEIDRGLPRSARCSWARRFPPRGCKQPPSRWRLQSSARWGRLPLWCHVTQGPSKRGRVCVTWSC
mmetsp:Transcript_3730/g.9243  ORF Transcript_3730/g.9243 Transcript_3730/m.9243 type:complete len:272 (+) Transcript_3730:274-1089(+)